MFKPKGRFSDYTFKKYIQSYAIDKRYTWKKKDVKRLKIKATDRTTKYEDNKF